MNIYKDAMLNVNDAALYLALPKSTLADWRRDEIIHGVPAAHRGWPNLPFVGVVEAFVLRRLRAVGFQRRQITEAAEGIRREFGDEYGLARPGVGHDEGVEIFIRIGGDLYRAKDRQQAIRETVKDFRECIHWNGDEPERLRLPELGNVFLDPRFGWGQPTLASSKVPVQSVVGLWYAGESLETIAAEFDMDPAEVDGLVRSWSRIHDNLAA